MKIRVPHLVELLEYLTKEDVMDINVELRDSVSSGIDCIFFDKEKRECKITLFQAGMNISPDLTKKMKLHTRKDKKKA